MEGHYFADGAAPKSCYSSPTITLACEALLATVGTLLYNLIPDSAIMGLDPLCHKEKYAALSQRVNTGTDENS